MTDLGAAVLDLPAGGGCPLEAEPVGLWAQPFGLRAALIAGLFGRAAGDRGGGDREGGVSFPDRASAFGSANRTCSVAGTADTGGLPQQPGYGLCSGVRM